MDHTKTTVIKQDVSELYGFEESVGARAQAAGLGSNACTGSMAQVLQPAEIAHCLYAQLGDCILDTHTHTVK